MDISISMIIKAIVSAVLLLVLINLVAFLIAFVQVANSTAWSFAWELGVFYVDGQPVGMQFGEKNTTLFLFLAAMVALWIQQRKAAKTVNEASTL